MAVALLLPLALLAAVQYDNIHGSGVSSAISFSCLHGGGPPTNATATPVLRNITVQNMALTGVVGDGYGVTGRRTCAYVQTLEETPIDGLFLKNVSISGSCNAAFSCASLTKTDIGAMHAMFVLVLHCKQSFAKTGFRTEVKQRLNE